MALRICNLVVFGLAWSASSRTCSSYDVIVYGTSASGVAAAVTAAPFNHSVAIVGPEIQLGGMVTGGLGATDIGFNASVIGGIAFEFFQRACTRSGARHQNPCFHFPPSFATAAFNAMMAGLAPSIDVHLETQLVETAKSGTLLTAITVTKGNKSSCLGAKGFIDASQSLGFIRCPLPYWSGSSVGVQRIFGWTYRHQPLAKLQFSMAHERDRS
eukprot:TRINITY_DN12360_c0_g2_i1.p1 TRINITY_DN12360_c0_g2~~TRINITY_DN12360_c0_g2_i1.p1  ORF type:complete len:214 (+),score=16.34 TRINITY_DN12360_c0_g2_i1:2-643(+)